MDNNKNQAVPPLIDQTKASENNERYFNLLVDEIPYRWNLNRSSLTTRCGIM